MAAVWLSFIGHQQEVQLRGCFFTQGRAALSRAAHPVTPSCNRHACQQSDSAVIVMWHHPFCCACAGHSLGGALATLAAYDIAKALEGLCSVQHDVICYTFGAPRTGELAQASLSATDITRLKVR